jgi:hypothetical protein
MPGVAGLCSPAQSRFGVIPEYSNTDRHLTGADRVRTQKTWTC